MPTLDDLKNDFVSFSTDQRGHWNTISSDKIHSIVQNQLTRSQTTFVGDTKAAYDALSAADKNTVIGMLPDEIKVNHDPC